MTTRFFIPALVAVPRLPGRFLFLSLFLILPLFSQAVLAQDAKNNWDEAMKINPGSKLTILAPWLARSSAVEARSFTRRRKQ